MSSIREEVRKYQQILNEKGYERAGNDGIPCQLFLVYIGLEVERDMLISFLKDCGLIRNMTCRKCQGQMHLQKEKMKSDGVVWSCKRMRQKIRCDTKTSIRKGSLFNKSKLSIPMILLLTYNILIGTPSTVITDEYKMSSATVSDWNHFVKEVLVNYIKKNSQRIGGVGKVVEIDKFKLGRKKDSQEHDVADQWVFGGVERGTGNVFLVPVKDLSQETAVELVKEWVHPGTTIITDYWKAYGTLEDEGFLHLTVDHSLNFVDPMTGAHTNTIGSTWRHVKEHLPSYNRQLPFEMYLADYMFSKRVGEDGKFIKFLEIVREIEWS